MKLSFHVKQLPLQAKTKKNMRRLPIMITLRPLNQDGISNQHFISVRFLAVIYQISLCIREMMDFLQNLNRFSHIPIWQISSEINKRFPIFYRAKKMPNTCFSIIRLNFSWSTNFSHQIEIQLGN